MVGRRQQQQQQQQQQGIVGIISKVSAMLSKKVFQQLIVANGRRSASPPVATVGAAVPSFSSIPSLSFISVGQHQIQNQQHPYQKNRSNEQRRLFWMDVVRVKTVRNKNNKKGERKHEDPGMVVRRHMDETRSDGEPLLDLMFYNDRHEKGWMKRKRLKEKKRHDFDKKKINDLAKYIAFVQDNKERK